MDLISHVNTRRLATVAILSTYVSLMAGCNDGTNTQASTAAASSSAAATTPSAPVTASVAPSSPAPAAPTAPNPASTAPQVSASIAPTTTNSWRYSLVSSSGQIIDSSKLNQNNSMSVGSTGAGGRPELEGANMAPLRAEELAAMRISTPVARVIQESILGYDSRYQVTPSTYPERAVALITYNGNTHCTGWLIGKDTIVTAGHCVHGGGISSRWGSTAAFRVYPGYSDGYAPYGSCNAKELYSSSGWIMSAENDADIGLIKLDCSVGNSTGYFSYFAADSVDNTAVTVNGYPGDKADAHQQWASDGTISRSTANKLFYDNDTTGGMSGSPVWLRNNGNAWAIGIHTNGEDASFSPGSNSGTRISQDIFDLMTAVKNLP